MSAAGRRDLRAGERPWDLCSVQAFVIFQDGNLGSRELATSLADKALGLAERLGHHGAAFMVLADRIRVAGMLGDLPQVEALGPQLVDIGERGGPPWRYLGHLFWAWPRTAEAMPSAPRLSCERPSSWSRRAHRRAKRRGRWRGTSPTTRTR